MNTPATRWSDANRAAISSVYTGNRAEHEDEGGHQDGHQAVAAALDGAGGHDGGDGARESGQQRHERATVQADSGHEAVADERGPGEVARVFEDGDEHEEHRDLGHEHDDVAHPTDHPLHEEVAERAFGQQVGRETLQQANAAFDAPHHGIGPRENGLKDQGHHPHEDQRAPYRVKQHGVDAVGQARAARPDRGMGAGGGGAGDRVTGFDDLGREVVWLVGIFGQGGSAGFGGLAQRFAADERVFARPLIRRPHVVGRQGPQRGRFRRLGLEVGAGAKIRGGGGDGRFAGIVDPPASAGAARGVAQHPLQFGPQLLDTFILSGGHADDRHPEGVG